MPLLFFAPTKKAFKPYQILVQHSQKWRSNCLHFEELNDGMHDVNELYSSFMASLNHSTQLDFSYLDPGVHVMPFCAAPFRSNVSPRNTNRSITFQILLVTKT